jgi:hypothetical protein
LHRGETPLFKKEMADRLGVHEQTVDRWAKHGIINAHDDLSITAGFGN